MYLYSGHGFVHIQSELLKKTRWARIVDKCLPKNASNQSNGVRLNIDEIRLNLHGLPYGNTNGLPCQ